MVAHSSHQKLSPGKSIGGSEITFLDSKPNQRKPDCMRCRKSDCYESLHAIDTFINKYNDVLTFQRFSFSHKMTNVQHCTWGSCGDSRTCGSVATRFWDIPARLRLSTWESYQFWDHSSFTNYVIRSYILVIWSLPAPRNVVCEWFLLEFTKRVRLTMRLWTFESSYYICFLVNFKWVGPELFEADKVTINRFWDKKVFVWGGVCRLSWPEM